MKKFFLLLMSFLMITLFTQCSRGTAPTEKDRSKAAKNDSAKKTAKNDHGQEEGKRGRRPGGKHGRKGDRGKEKDQGPIEIPERMKQAIKSGRITKEQALKRLKQRRGGGDAPNVKVEKVTRKPINAFLELNGTVEPERKVAVYSRLSAYVKKIVKEEGDFVKKNDILALLDDTEIRISYRQSEIQLEQANLTLLDEEKNYLRNKKLNETEMISEKDFQLSEAVFQKAKLDHKARLENFKELQLQLSYTKIKSPSEGYVTERQIEMGTRVNVNQQIYTVEDFTPLLVKIYVPTSDVVNLKLDMETQITTDILSGRMFTGRIKLINPRIDVQSGTVKVTVEVFDKSLSLKPGMFVETKVLISNNPKAIVIPKKSVSYKRDEAFVFVFDRQERNVARRIIKTGVTEGGNIEILEGLEEDERIVTVGVESLKDKMKVKVIR